MHIMATATVDDARACPIHLLQNGASHEVVAVLSGLLEAAEAGHLTGIVFGASLRGQTYFCEAAGTLHRNAVTGLGVATMLTAELEHRIRLNAIDTSMP
jgi:hypothetical protein